MLAWHSLWLVGALACATPQPRAGSLTMTTVVLGPEAATNAISSRLTAPIDGVSFAIAPLPEAVASAIDDDHAVAIARARKAYVDADFPACRAALDPIDAILLIERERDTAARILMWRVACHLGGGDRDGARKDATILATAGLAVPPDISAVTPDVEALLGDASARVGKAPTAALHVVTKPPSSRIAFDGRADSCAAPCTLTLVAGTHTISVSADGFTTVSRRVQVPADRKLSVELVEAAPPIVATQLQLRIARGIPVDDRGTLALAARAVRARQIAVLAVDERKPPHLIGALFADGKVTARAEAVFGADAPVEVAHELLDRGGVVPAVPLWRRPRFWISVVAAAAIAAGVTGYLLFRSDPQSRVVFP